jgi:hypothetical protein
MAAVLHVVDMPLKHLWRQLPAMKLQPCAVGNLALTVFCDSTCLGFTHPHVPPTLKSVLFHGWSALL